MAESALQLSGGLMEEEAKFNPLEARHLRRPSTPTAHHPPRSQRPVEVNGTIAPSPSHLLRNLSANTALPHGTRTPFRDPSEAYEFDVPARYGVGTRAHNLLM